MALSAKSKLRLLDVLDIFKSIGITALLVFAIQNQHTQNRQIKVTQDQVVATKQVVDQIKSETVELKKDNHNDHDSLLKSINCMSELFGAHPDEVIPKSEFDACLAGTRIVALLSTSGDSVHPAPTNNNTNNKQPTAASPTAGTTNTSQPTKQSSSNQQGQGGSNGNGGIINGIIKRIKNLL